MDNSPIHCSANVRRYMKESEYSCIYLPQYTPELAPVELFFGRVKQIISTKRTDTVIDLDNESGKQILAEVVSSIGRVSIIKIWNHFISILKQTIGELDSIFELET